jgi:hypothetical protein
VKLTFNDFGEVDLDKLECHKNIRRSDVFSPFVGEFGEIPAQDDEVELRFKDGTVQTTKDLSSILKLEQSQVPKC